MSRHIPDSRSLALNFWKICRNFSNVKKIGRKGSIYNLRFFNFEPFESLCFQRRRLGSIWWREHPKNQVRVYKLPKSCWSDVLGFINGWFHWWLLWLRKIPTHFTFSNLFNLMSFFIKYEVNFNPYSPYPPESFWPDWVLFSVTRFLNLVDSLVLNQDRSILQSGSLSRMSLLHLVFRWRARLSSRDRE